MSTQPDPRVAKVLSKIDKCNKHIADLQKSIVSKDELQEKLRLLRQKFSQTEATFKNKGLVNMLKFNSDYKINQSEHKKLEEIIENYKDKLNETNSKIIGHLKTKRSHEKELEKIKALIEDERLIAERQRLTEERNKQALADKQAQKAKNKAAAQARAQYEKDKANALERRLATINATNAINRRSIVSKSNAALAVTITPDWKDVIFADGYVLVRHNNMLYKKQVNKAKRVFNDIKSYYTFKDVPRLQVVIKGTEIFEIKNQEVLFFHIELFSASGSIFGQAQISDKKIHKWSKYTKEYYRKHLPFALHTHCLDKLCKVCDPTLPIIPLAEIVINSKGSTAVHNSFLFPIRNKSGIKVVWESIEVSKASYVFETQADYWLCAQNIYDYISGATVNKRDTLLNSAALRAQLKMRQRIMHTNLTEWESSIACLK